MAVKGHRAMAAGYVKYPIASRYSGRRREPPPEMRQNPWPCIVTSCRRIKPHPRFGFVGIEIALHFRLQVH